ncbi:hypothetical protein MASR1M36_21210 [Candidatus Cloacimonadaceae bacterium]
MYLASFLDARDICIEQRVLSKQQVYQMLVDRICAHHQLPSCGTKLLELILQREEEAPVAYASGIAIPHIRMEGFEDTVVAMAFLQNPIDYEGTKISWIVLIITDKTSSKTYLNIVAALLKLSKDSEAMANLAAAHDGHSVVHRLKEMAVMVKKDLFISDIMIVDPVSIQPGATLKELNTLMSQYGIAGLPVVDQNLNYLGEVNILDLLKVGIPDYLMMLDNLNFLMSFEPLEKLFENENEIKVSEIMSRDEIYLRPEASIIEAVFEMILHKKRYMSVVKEGKLVGLVTAMDVLRKVITA